MARTIVGCGVEEGRNPTFQSFARKMKKPLPHHNMTNFLLSATNDSKLSKEVNEHCNSLLNSEHLYIAISITIFFPYSSC